jgi:hypothetical protein
VSSDTAGGWEDEEEFKLLRRESGRDKKEGEEEGEKCSSKVWDT